MLSALIVIDGDSQSPLTLKIKAIGAWGGPGGICDTTHVQSRSGDNHLAGGKGFVPG